MQTTDPLGSTITFEVIGTGVSVTAVRFLAAAAVELAAAVTFFTAGVVVLAGFGTVEFTGFVALTGFGTVEFSGFVGLTGYGVVTVVLALAIIGKDNLKPPVLNLSKFPS